jgi:hypothetical protein
MTGRGAPIAACDRCHPYLLHSSYLCCLIPAGPLLGRQSRASGSDMAIEVRNMGPVPHDSRAPTL